MGMRGSLETFSLPELFQIIGSGNKSGKLTINPSSKNHKDRLNTTFELWFKNGNFVTIINSLKFQALVEDIIDKGWIDSQVLVRSKYSCPSNKSLGKYIEEEKLLDSSQIDLLFAQQLSQVSELFHLKYAWFKFDEISSKNKMTKDGETFPWNEMTGKEKKATKVSLEAMRDFSDWSRFAEEIPPGETGLQKLSSNCDLQLTHLEQHLWDTANGSRSLNKIAKKQGLDLTTVQRTALSMILAGLVEEVPIVYSAQQYASSKQVKKQTKYGEGSNTALKTKAKSKVSTSLINNLVSFLKDNF